MRRSYTKSIDETTCGSCRKSYQFAQDRAKRKSVYLHKVHLSGPGFSRLCRISSGVRFESTEDIDGVSCENCLRLYRSKSDLTRTWKIHISLPGFSALCGISLDQGLSFVGVSSEASCKNCLRTYKSYRPGVSLEQVLRDQELARQAGSSQPKVHLIEDSGWTFCSKQVLECGFSTIDLKEATCKTCVRSYKLSQPQIQESFLIIV